jgi:tetratricopeptide (TPR) repeat protein
MILAALLFAQAVQTAETARQRPPEIDSATAAIHDGKPEEALDTLSPVIAAYDARFAGEKRRVYCGMSGAETILYMGMSAKDKAAAVAVDPFYCIALFLKGYALIDLGRVREARVLYQKAASLAPMHAEFLTELGQSYRPEKNWAAMLATCRTAVSAAELGDDGDHTQKRAALRCTGYALVEQGKLADAEAAYRECLKLFPADAKARNELQYIAEQRGKRT